MPQLNSSRTLTAKEGRRTLVKGRVVEEIGSSRERVSTRGPLRSDEAHTITAAEGNERLVIPRLCPPCDGRVVTRCWVLPVTRELDLEIGDVGVRRSARIVFLCGHYVASPVDALVFATIVGEINAVPPGYEMQTLVRSGQVGVGRRIYVNESHELLDILPPRPKAVFEIARGIELTQNGESKYGCHWSERRRGPGRKPLFVVVLRNLHDRIVEGLDLANFLDDPLSLLELHLFVGQERGARLRRLLGIRGGVHSLSIGRRAAHSEQDRDKPP
jgi:hypothetical protein